MYRYNSGSISICVVPLHITPKISEDFTWTDQFTDEKNVYTNCFIVIVVFMESHYPNTVF